MLKTLVLLLTLLLTACAGGTIGGLVPAPKIVKGKLDGTRYTSPSGDFSVTAPVSEKGGEWLYTEVRESENTTEDIRGVEVQFKTPYDNNFFSTIVYSYPASKRADDPKNFFPQLVSSAAQRFAEFNAKPEIVSNKDLVLGGHNGNYGVARMRFTAKGKNVDKAYVVYSFCERTKCAVTVAELNRIDGFGKIPEEISSASWEKFNQFAGSVKLFP